MTLIICESLRQIGEMACVTSAWSSRGQTLKAGMALATFAYNNTPQQYAVKNRRPWNLFDSLRRVPGVWERIAAFQIIILARVIDSD